MCAEASPQLLLRLLQKHSSSLGDASRPGITSYVPSLLSAFGSVPLVSLQPLSHAGECGGARLSGWQPSYYVAPDAAYQAGVTAPASQLKGDTTVTRRAASVAAGE